MPSAYGSRATLSIIFKLQPVFLRR
jgi:hypothetical protein